MYIQKYHFSYQIRVKFVEYKLNCKDLLFYSNNRNFTTPPPKQMPIKKKYIAFSLKID